MRLLAAFAFIFSLVFSSSFDIAQAMAINEEDLTARLLEDVSPFQAPAARPKKHSVKTDNSCPDCCCPRGCKSDQRQKVSPDEGINTSNVYISAYFPSVGWRRGTATIISENCMITAAHCLHHEGEDATKVMAIFGLHEVVECGSFFGSLFSCMAKSCAVKKDEAKALATGPIFAIHPDYRRNPTTSPNDIAILTFNKPPKNDFLAAGVDFSPYESWYDQYDGVQIKASGETFIYGQEPDFSIGRVFYAPAIGIYSQQALENREVTITGYPIYAGRSCKSSYSLYSMSGRIRETTESLLLHKIATTDGQSGAGVCLRTINGPQIVGVHIGEHDEEYNEAVWFNPSVIAFLNQHLIAFDRQWASINLLKQ